MKKIFKSLMVAFALVVTLSVGTSNTAEAAVKSVKVVSKLTGSKKISIAKGKKANLKPIVTVTGKSSKKVTYKSKQPKIATVNSKGTVKGKKKGTATIVVTSKANKKKKAKIKVKVLKNKVTKVRANVNGNVAVKQEVTIKEGEKLAVKGVVSVSKNSSVNKVLKWESSNSAVAKADKKSGTVTGLKAGDATITLRSTDGTGKKAYITVHVVKAEVKTDEKPVVKPDVKPSETVTPAPTPVATKTTTAVTLKDNADVTVTVDFTSAEDAQKDLNDLAELVASKNATYSVTVGGKKYDGVYDGTNVTINGKLVSEYGKDSVTASFKTKASKVTGLFIAFQPTSVKAVTVNDVVFTDVTLTSVTINGTSYNYAVTGKTTVTVDGDASASLKGLDSVASIVVETK